MDITAGDRTLGYPRIDISYKYNHAWLSTPLGLRIPYYFSNLGYAYADAGAAYIQGETVSNMSQRPALIQYI